MNRISKAKTRTRGKKHNIKNGLARQKKNGMVDFCLEYRMSTSQWVPEEGA